MIFSKEKRKKQNGKIAERHCNNFLIHARAKNDLKEIKMGQEFYIKF